MSRGKRFESARRLSIFGLDKLSVGPSEATYLLSVEGATVPQRTAALSLSERGNKLGAPTFAKRGLYLVPLKVAPGSLRVYIVMKV
jgi:hypothetical protein